MTDILLVEPKIKGSWGKNNQYTGLLRVGNWLKSEGHDVEYIIYPTLPENKPEEIYITSMFTYNYLDVWDAVHHYKMTYPNAKLLLGGIYATICPEHAKISGADEVIVGRHPLASEYPPDPTLLPYHQDFAYLFTSYGCSRACTFCATHLIFGKGITQTPIDKVLSEIEFLVSKGIKKVRFGDDDLLHDSENHINAICEGILNRGWKLELRVTGGVSAKDLTLETASLMRRAGFVEISFSLESTSDELRKRMGRANNTTPNDLERALSYTDKVGFKRSQINVYFIIGLPYQKVSDMVDTLFYLIKLNVWTYPQRFTPIPHTVIWKQMGIEDMDYASLDYRKFVAPNQDNFTDRDLKEIAQIAWSFNNARLRGNLDFVTADPSPVINSFRQRMLEYLKMVDSHIEPISVCKQDKLF